MDSTILQHIRHILSAYSIGSDINAQLAVQGMEAILKSCGISLQHAASDITSVEGPIKQIEKYTNFFALHTDTLNTLIIRLVKKKDTQRVTEYAISLQRFAEINLPYLLNKTREKTSFTAHEMRFHYMKVIAFLLDYYYCYGDLRYLNTCLKLMDYEWIFSLENIKSEKATIRTLLECRLWLMTEFALDKLKNNEKSSNILP